MVTPDPSVVLADLRARLTGRGAPFELAERDIPGGLTPVFVNARTSLLDWLMDSDAYGEREFLAQGDRRLSYAGHLESVAALADILAAEYGVAPGDRVAIFAGNCPDWVVSFWAAISLGAVVVAANAWWTATEVEHALARTTPTMIIADGVRAAVLDSVDDAARPRLLRMSEVPRLIAARGHAVLPEVRPDPADPAVLMYTSGTTGGPKAAVHSHRNLLAVIEYHRYTDVLAAELASVFGFPRRSGPRRFLMSLPLFHIASLHNLALPRMATGDTIVVDEGRFDLERVLRLIEREKITNWAIVPTMATRLVAHESLAEYDLSSLTALSINSAPSSPALKERVRQTVPTVQAALADSYGLTEASTAVTVATAHDLALHPSSVGRPIPGVEISIRDGGEPVADGVEGEIWLRSQFTMLGYWGDQQATDEVLGADGWLRTGDLGSMRDGRLFMAARRGDLILRGGENVYPAEVEAVLAEHPSVDECAVFGVDDPDLGQAVAAIVVGPNADAAELRTFARERLAYYKVPAHWQLSREPLPRTATGKVIRSSLPSRTTR